MTSFLTLFKALNDAQVQYLVAGGWAVNLYGIERATGDIDLVVWLDQPNLEKFVTVLDRLGLKPKAPVPLADFTVQEKREEWIHDKGMMVFSFFDPQNPFFLMDVFITVPFDFETVYNRRSNIAAGAISIPVVPLKTLIEMKECAGRPQDIADLYYLKKLESERNNV